VDHAPSVRLAAAKFILLSERLRRNSHRNSPALRPIATRLGRRRYLKKVPKSAAESILDDDVYWIAYGKDNEVGVSNECGRRT